jgi:hypothetical protein
VRGQTAGAISCHEHLLRLAFAASGPSCSALHSISWSATSRGQLSTGLLEAQVSQMEIADGIGSARQVVARGFADQRTRGLVATTHRRVKILNPVRLEALAVSNLV